MRTVTLDRTAADEGIWEGILLGYWRKHPRKEGEEALRQIAELGWRIENPPTYYTIKCPCGNHQRQVHLTPANPNYWNQTVRFVRRVCPPEQKEDV